MRLPTQICFAVLWLLVLAGAGSPAHASGLSANSTVFVILMENRNWSEIKGSADAPYLNNFLLPMASYAEGYCNPAGLHPSEPNYLWLEAGTNFGIYNSNPPAINHQATSDHLVAELRRAGIPWRTYQEDLPCASPVTEDCYPYAVRHNPFVFFDDVLTSGEVVTAVRPFAELGGDLIDNHVARYNFITPNLINDMHDAAPPAYNAIRQGDDWLAQTVPAILQSAAYRNDGLLIIVWDEGSYASSDGPIGLIVLSAQAKGGGYHNSLRYTHGSTLRTLQKIFGVGPLLGGAATSLDLSDLFVTNAIPNADCELHLKALPWTAGGFTVQWDSQPGLTYQVQWSNTPGSDGPWQGLLPTLAGTSGPLSLTDDGSQTGGFPNTERFYRVVVP